MKLAIVHDWIRNLTGAERVLKELHEMYPTAPIYTLFYNRKFVRHYLPNTEIKASFLQKIPFINNLYPLFLPLMPVAIESFDLSGFDTVVSSSAIFSKGLVLKPSTRHICYCYSPSRFLWDRGAEYARESESWWTRVGQHLMRLWDRPAADRVDQFVAISKTVAERIKKYYRRDSVVIYPPVSRISETVNSKLETRNFYLIVSRLYNYKNIHVAIEAFNKIGYPLAIIGSGPAEKELRSIADKNITFLGEKDDTIVSTYYSSCRAFIMPQEEDFGLTAIEAMSHGKPVLALRRGGATETVIEGVTGEFFDDPIPEALADGLRRLNENYSKYNPETIKLHTQKYSVLRFREEISMILK